MRPIVAFLSDKLIGQIVSEARHLLCTLGVEIHNASVLSMLSDHGAEVKAKNHRAYLPEVVIDRALEAAPSSFQLYDVLGRQSHDFAGHNVHFTPGSAAIHILDHGSNQARTPTTDDYIRYVKLVGRLEHLASQSTAIIPGDVHPNISDSYRLFLSLLYGAKPVVTGAFTIDAFNVMKDLQLGVRGSERHGSARCERSDKGHRLGQLMFHVEHNLRPCAHGAHR
jgi:trimethylamine--corrinoid protein Co-methyltransferase